MSKHEKADAVAVPHPVTIAEAHEVIDAEEVVNDENQRLRGELNRINEHWRETELKYPGGLNKFERDWRIQLVYLVVFLIIAVVNIRLNFKLIGVYEDLFDDIKGLPNVNDLDSNVVQDMVNEFNAKDDTSATCSVDFFAFNFSKNDLESEILTVTRIVKASTYLTVGVIFWIVIFLKVMSIRKILHQDFKVMPTQKLLEMKRAGLLNENGELKEALRPKVENDMDIIRTRNDQKKKFMNKDEKQILMFLKADSVLFGLEQVFQDIPIGTACICYVFFLIREKGVLCYEAFTEGRVSQVFTIDEVPGIIFSQMAIIILNIVINLAFNLAPRWVAFIKHQKVKEMIEPRFIAYPILQISFYLMIYLLAVFLPVFAILYSPYATNIFGVDTTSNGGFLVLVILSAVCMGFALFYICAHCGINTLGELVVCCIIIEATETACSGIPFCEEICDQGECCCFCC